MTDGVRIVTIPRHDPVDGYTMAGIVRAAGLTEERFRDLLLSECSHDSVVQGLGIPEDEISEGLRAELAVALYAQGALSLGMAAELADMSRMVFGELVGLRGIARHYGEAELEEDVVYARGE